MVSTNNPPRTSPCRHQFGRHTRTTHAGIHDIIAYIEFRQFQPRRGFVASTLTFCGYTFLHLNMELLSQCQYALQRTLDLSSSKTSQFHSPADEFANTEKTS